MAACLMVRREAIEGVGLLDERFFMFFEDVDWCYRIKQRGWKIYFTPEAKVIHLGAQSVSSIWHIMGCEYRKSAYRYFRKHERGSIALAIFRVGLLIETAISILPYEVRSLSRENRELRSRAIQSRISLIKTLWHE